MNNSTYIFGKLGSGYTQYPSDSLKENFEKCVNLAKDEKQIVVNRIGSMMYYTFVQFLDKRHTQYIGLSLAFSELVITEFKSLFELFENGITCLAIEGEILSFKKNKIVAETTTLKDKGAEAKNIDNYLSIKLSCIKNNMRSLPATNYAVSNQTVKRCNLFSNQNNIFKNTITYGYTIIYQGDISDKSESDLETILKLTEDKQQNNIFIRFINKIATLCK